jgi:hypothetical protein
MSLIMRSEEFTVSAGGSTNMPVPSTGTYYTNAVRVDQAASMSLSYKAAVTAGAPDLKIEIQQCWRPPTTEYASDADYVVASGVSDVESNLTGVTRVLKGSLGQVTSKYIRLKITAQGTNHASTTLNARLNVQEEI